MINKYNFYYRFFVILFWVSMCFNFVVEEFFVPLKSLEFAFSVFVQFAFALLGLLLLRNKHDILVIGAFLAITVLSTLIINGLPVKMFINGLRNFFALLFAIPVIRFFVTGPGAAEFKARFDKQLQIWLYIQAVCVMWQFFKYGANDAGGGSMGYGASGMVSMLIYLISYYLVVQKWDFDDFLGSLRRNYANVLLLLPTFFNETKISFVLLILYFLLLYKPSRSAILKVIYVVPVVIALGAGLIATYLHATGADADYVLSMDFVDAYFFGAEMDETIEIAMDVQDGYYDDGLEEGQVWLLDIARLAKFPLTIPELEKTPGGLVLGAGLGNLNGGKRMGESDFSRKNRWMLIGSRPWSFTLLVETGFCGIIWFFWMVISGFFCGFKYSFFSKRMYFYLGICIFLMLFYNEALWYVNFCIPFFYLGFAVRLVDKGRESSESSIKEAYLSA